jgi:hypothetical protein
MTFPKVLICMPTYGFVKTRTTESLARLVAFTFAKNVAMVAFHFEDKCSVIPKARNKMADVGRSNGFDFIFFIDSDMQFPQDTLARLISHDRDICGVLYNKRVPQIDPVGQPENPNVPFGQRGLVEAKELGCGVLLIRASVFDRLKRPWFYHRDGEDGEDFNFIRDCKAAGITAWADLDLSFDVGHVGEFAVSFRRPVPGLAPTVTVS